MRDGGTFQISDCGMRPFKDWGHCVGLRNGKS
jgi:hypothetical protein